MALTALAPQQRAELLTRIAASASAACLLTHVALLALTRASMLTMTVPMLGLSLLCASCSLRAWWRRCSEGELVLMALASLTMVLVHTLAPMHGGASASGVGDMPGMPGMSMADMPGMSAPGSVPPGTDLLMHGGLVLAILAGLLAAAVLVRRLLVR